MATGKVSTLSYSAALERRGAAPVRPSALSSLTSERTQDYQVKWPCFKGQKRPFY